MNVNRMLLLFPKYLELNAKFMRSLLRTSEGPLPVPWRFYISIMAAS